jgi:long-chain-fatty-acid--CoA ligase ACSBG
MGKPLALAPHNKPSDVPKYSREQGPFWTDAADGEKKVRFSETGFASEKVTPSKTIIEVMELAAKKHPTKIALRTENMPALKKGEKAPEPLPLEQWQSWTWKSYLSDTRKMAKALMKVGHVQHDAVNVFGFNSPQWFISQMGTVFAGGKVAGIYPSDTPEQVQFKSFHSNASVALLERESEFQKFADVIDQLPYLKAVVVWACDRPMDLRRKDGSVCRVYGFEEFLKMGADVPEKTLDERIAKIKPTHCCCLIYTSGTTGKPKAVMISHDNLAYEANSVMPLSGLGTKAEEERLLSYLPLSHVAGMMVDIVCPIVVTAYTKGWMSSNFARVYDLKIGTIGQRLNSVRPTMFLGVPRVWEKIMEKLQAVGAATTGLKKTLSTTAKAKGLKASMNQQLGGNGKVPFLYGVYGKLLAVIKTKLGLDHCKFAFAGAAPMTKEVLSYFGSLGINVNEVYGMSESTGATTWSTDAAHQWGTVGFELPGCEVKCFKVGGGGGALKECPRAADIFHPSEAEQGEICFRGRHVMMGYLSNPKLGDTHVEEIRKKNTEAIDDEGWLHSGDKGAISKHGMVRITGRYKELIIGAGGENIAPVPIEDNIKMLCPYVANVMMYGDKRKFNIALLTLKCVGATGELPGTNELDGAAKVYGKTIEEACANTKLIDAITNAFKATAKDGDCTPSSAAVVQKFTVLPIDFSVQTNELTATLKLKRSEVGDKYAKLIDAVYNSPDSVVFVNYKTVGSYDAVKGKAEELRGSFKANAPLDMVDDENAVQLEVKGGKKGDDEDEPGEEDK